MYAFGFIYYYFAFFDVVSWCVCVYWLKFMCWPVYFLGFLNCCCYSFFWLIYFCCVYVCVLTPAPTSPHKRNHLTNFYIFAIRFFVVPFLHWVCRILICRLSHSRSPILYIITFLTQSILWFSNGTLHKNEFELLFDLICYFIYMLVSFSCDWYFWPFCYAILVFKHILFFQ